MTKISNSAGHTKATSSVRKGTTTAKSDAKASATNASVVPRSGKAPQANGRQTKLADLIAMLRDKRGASIDQLVKAIGWQKHSVRGAISGALKKKLGLKVISEKSDAGRTYRIVG